MSRRSPTRLLLRWRRRVSARMETYEILRDPELVAAIREAEAEIARGEVYAADEVRAMLEEHWQAKERQHG
ncbi:hypothetical protein [Demequina maris]|uniref:hypothetical protein n=1 Tax=Demequina maris TaxID=1638982 RepID=UPI0012E05825|nr:hypothetical protein [Demequina maris]